MNLQRLAQGTAVALFAHRAAWLAGFAVVTVALVWSATRLQFDAAFEKWIPARHPYMDVFATYRDAFGGANRLLVALVAKDGDIFDSASFEALRSLTDDVFFIPGVERSTVTSLFTPNVRFTEVVERGFTGGPVVPPEFRGTDRDLERVRRNVLKAGEAGRLVASDFSGALVRADLAERDPRTGSRLDYLDVAERLEALRAKYEDGQRTLHVIGFAKIVGDVIGATRDVLQWFAVAIAVIALMLLASWRDARTVAIVLAVALLPVVWLFGALPLLGYGIDPVSVLVPFLVFAIGVSHAAQMAGAWRAGRLRGDDALAAARGAFAELFVPGAVALLANALGFLVIMMIPIGAVRELGLTAALGVLLMVLTNKLLLPVLLSFGSGRVPSSHAGGRALTVLHGVIAKSATPRTAWVTVALWSAFAAWATVNARDLRTGDLTGDQPEFRADSRYNLDAAAIASRFRIGVDVLSVYAQSTGVNGACTDFDVMDAVDRFETALRGVDGVLSVSGLAGAAKLAYAGWNEGSLKWRALPRNRDALAQSVVGVTTSSGLTDAECNAMQVIAYTRDHRGDTVAHVVGEARRFADLYATPKVRFLLAGGNVGVTAATNEAVNAAERRILIALFGAVGLLCLLAFRSWRAALCILVPLAIVSIACNALMARLGIGLKVATLPVIALGVGVGVDYGIYLLDRIRRTVLERGASLHDAFGVALRARGGTTLLTAAAVAIAVAAWVFSALAYQAEMGMLLAFMFLLNALGALTLLPALAAWLDVPRRCARAAS
jgi:predicted RND superfamily exporter protein